MRYPNPNDAFAARVRVLSRVAGSLELAFVVSATVVDKLRMAEHVFRTPGLRLVSCLPLRCARMLEVHETLKRCRRWKVCAGGGATETPPCLSHPIRDYGHADEAKRSRVVRSKTCRRNFSESVAFARVNAVGVPTRGGPRCIWGDEYEAMPYLFGGSVDLEVDYALVALALFQDGVPDLHRPVTLILSAGRKIATVKDDVRVYDS